MTAARYLEGGLLRTAPYQRLLARLASDLTEYQISRVPLDDGLLDEARVLVPQYPA